MNNFDKLFLEFKSDYERLFNNNQYISKKRYKMLLDKYKNLIKKVNKK